MARVRVVGNGALIRLYDDTTGAELPLDVVELTWVRGAPAPALRIVVDARDVELCLTGAARVDTNPLRRRLQSEEG